VWLRGSLPSHDGASLRHGEGTAIVGITLFAALKNRFIGAACHRQKTNANPWSSPAGDTIKRVATLWFIKSLKAVSLNGRGKG